MKQNGFTSIQCQPWHLFSFCKEYFYTSWRTILNQHWFVKTTVWRKKTQRTNIFENYFWRNLKLKNFSIHNHSLWMWYIAHSVWGFLLNEFSISFHSGQSLESLYILASPYLQYKMNSKNSEGSAESTRCLNAFDCCCPEIFPQVVNTDAEKTVQLQNV